MEEMPVSSQTKAYRGWVISAQEDKVDCRMVKNPTLWDCLFYEMVNKKWKPEGKSGAWLSGVRALGKGNGDVMALRQ